MMNQSYLGRGFGSLGDVSTDPAFVAAQQAIARAEALPNFNSLAGNASSQFFSIFNNLRNTINAWASGTNPTYHWSQDTVAWTKALNDWITANPPPADTRPAIERDPITAAYVRGLYQNYFGREPDASGWNFWTAEIINARKTREQVAQAFAADAEAVAYAAAKAQQQAAATTVAQLQAQIAALQAQVAAGTTNSTAAQAQIASLQQQLAAAQAAAGSTSGTDEGFFSKIMDFASENKLIVGGAAAVGLLLMMGGDSGPKRRR